MADQAFLPLLAQAISLGRRVAYPAIALKGALGTRDPTAIGRR